MYSVINKDNSMIMSDDEIIVEVNRDRSDEWQDYSIVELKDNPSEVLQWIDTEYYIVKGA